jgi:hypothetical protein
MPLALRNSTGNEPIDTLLRELLTQLELAFPTRVRSYYLGGSTSDGTAVGHDRSPNSSDIDLFVIIRGTIAEEHAHFQNLVAQYQRTSPLQVDAHAYAEDDLLRPPRREATQTSFLSALIQVAGVLLYGEDLRAELPAVSFPRYVLDVICIRKIKLYTGLPHEPRKIGQICRVFQQRKLYTGRIFGPQKLLPAANKLYTSRRARQPSHYSFGEIYREDALCLAT